MMKHVRSWSVLCLFASLLISSAKAENLYDEKSFRPLASDKRAHLPGDNLTVLIYENSSASTRADTTLQRNNDVSIQASVNQQDNRLGVGVGNGFDGGGSVQRSGKLLAQMTVTVLSTTPGGDLLVAGEQLLEINSDRQQIRVEGRVRPLDISDTNTVMSYRLADAKISYLGDGDLASRQRPSFWSRLFIWAGF